MVSFTHGNEKNIAANIPEMVTISRAEYGSQQAQLTELKLQNQWFLEQLGLVKKWQFGAFSEQLDEGLMDQLSIMANVVEAYAYGTKNATAEQVAVKALARKRQGLKQWPYLVRYLEDGRLELSNNRAERSIKPFLMGRKNWLFSNTPAGAQSSAVIYSLI